VNLSLMVVTWPLTMDNSFLRASSVSRVPAMIQGRSIRTRNTETAQGNNEDLPSTTAWRSAAASLAFCSASFSFFFRSVASFYAWCTMASLTRWISCAATTSACSFAS
jgi:hypothetical protein